MLVMLSAFFGSMAAFVSGGAGTAISVIGSGITLAGGNIKSPDVPDHKEYEARTEENLEEVFDTTGTWYDELLGEICGSTKVTRSYMLSLCHKAIVTSVPLTRRS
jgi:hypothetical protein